MRQHMFFRLGNEVQIYLGKVRNTEISLPKPSGNLGVRLWPGYKLGARVQIDVVSILTRWQ